MKRRTLLTVVMLAATLGTSTVASAQEKATLRLNWLIYGFHTPFHLGVERGYYKAEGIELEIGEGKGSASAVQVIGSRFTHQLDRADADQQVLAHAFAVEMVGHAREFDFAV